MAVVILRITPNEVLTTTHVTSGIDNAGNNALTTCNRSTATHRGRLRLQEYARQLPTTDQCTFHFITFPSLELTGGFMPGFLVQPHLP
jgi:hypothetical protein